MTKTVYLDGRAVVVNDSCKLNSIRIKIIIQIGVLMIPKGEFPDVIVIQPNNDYVDLILEFHNYDLLRVYTFNNDNRVIHSFCYSIPM